MSRTKHIPILLIMIGLALVLYGGLFHSRPVRENKGLVSPARPETYLVRQVTFGGLARRPFGLQQTYSGLPGQGPALCPT